MKKSVLLILFVLLLILNGCVVDLPLPEITTQPDESEMLTSEVTVTQIDEVSAEIENEGTTAADVSEIATEIISTSEVEENTSEITTVAEPLTEIEETTVRQDITEVDLSIAMPEKNGIMQTDKSPDNKFIKIVCKNRTVDSGLLVAVFSVPDTGQNYVFEFNDKNERDADDIRRVYLIDMKGNITSVAAVNAKEKENISSVENWFCMNVLIKEIVYPAVEEFIK